jgi:hypothetical protein
MAIVIGNRSDLFIFYFYVDPNERLPIVYVRDFTCYDGLCHQIACNGKQDQEEQGRYNKWL